MASTEKVSCGSSDGLTAVFICGSGRCGTTMLADLLSAPPGYVAPPESGFKKHLVDRKGNASLGHAERLELMVGEWDYRIWGPDCRSPEFLHTLRQTTSLRESYEVLVTAYAKSIGEAGLSCFIDHTPDNVMYPDALVEAFPDAKLIHIVRDPRAVAASIMRLDWGPNTARDAARWWLSRVSMGLAAYQSLGQESVMLVRYEDILANPEASLREICEFCGIRYSEEMLEGKGFRLPAYTEKQHKLVGGAPIASRLNAWERTLDPREVGIIDSALGDVMRLLGYNRSKFSVRPGVFYTATRQLYDRFWLRRKSAQRRRKRLAAIDE